MILKATALINISVLAPSTLILGGNTSNKEILFLIVSRLVKFSIIKMFAGSSYEAVREWYQKGKVLFEESTKKKVRKWIAVDEKENTINGTTNFIWGAVDLDDEKVIAVWVSFGRSGLEASAFLKKVRDVCEGELPRIFSATTSSASPYFFIFHLYRNLYP